MWLMAWNRFAWVAFGTCTLFACIGRVSEGTSPDGTDSGTDSGGGPTTDGATPTCGSSERFYNGECRPLCTASSQCPTGTQCMTIDPSAAVCLPYGHCSYLGDDAQCLGTGFYDEYTRFGMETVPYPSTPWNANPYDHTPYVDSTFEALPGTPYPYTTPEGYGCEGDAQFVKIVATGDVACGAVHDVVRCRRLGNACVLVQGTTVDLVSP